MIVLTGRSEEKNTEMREILNLTGIHGLSVDFYNKFSVDSVTPLGYYLCDRKDPGGKPFFWLDLQVPQGWNFASGSLREGAIYEKGVLQAKVSFREPLEEQCIDRIDWIRTGEIYASDFYNAFGFRYMRAVPGGDAPKLRTFYDENGHPVITGWEDEGAVSLLRRGKETFYGSRAQFCREFLRGLADAADKKADRIVCFYESELLQYVLEGFPCVFFQMGKACDILSDPAFIRRLSAIVVNDPDALTKIHAFREARGAEGFPKICEIGQMVKNDPPGSVRDALVVTRSQHIEKLQQLAEGLPEMHFHIAARTVMAPGLMDFDRFDNVSLYPNSSDQKLRELLDRCAVYLDINHYLEYEGIVLAAVKADRLVYAFDNTAHQRGMTAEECIFLPEEADRMIREIRSASEETERFAMLLERQRGKNAVTEEQVKALSEELSRLQP